MHANNLIPLASDLLKCPAALTAPVDKITARVTDQQDEFCGVPERAETGAATRLDVRRAWPQLH
jgi:hypothetical protein